MTHRTDRFEVGDSDTCLHLPVEMGDSTLFCINCLAVLRTAEGLWTNAYYRKVGGGEMEYMEAMMQQRYEMVEPEYVYLRLTDAGTDNECWVVCAEGDLGAVRFVGDPE